MSIRPGDVWTPEAEYPAASTFYRGFGAAPAYLARAAPPTLSGRLV